MKDIIYLLDATSCHRGLMNQDLLAQQLLRAETSIDRETGASATQRRLIARLERDGHETTEARKLLATFEERRSLSLAEWDRLSRQLGQRNDEGDVTVSRELIEPKGRKRYARRTKEGRFTSRRVEIGRSLKKDRRSRAKTVAKKGEGDRGDQRRSS